MSKFKVGDRVRCIEGGERHENGTPGGYGWGLGLEFVVESISSNVYWGGLDGHGVYEDWLELASPEEPEKKVSLGKWKANL